MDLAPKKNTILRYTVLLNNYHIEKMQITINVKILE